MASKCGVCHDSDSKYKCPTCELRYCSINCYKSHKLLHLTDPVTAEVPKLSDPFPAIVASEPTTDTKFAAKPRSARNTQPSFASILTDPAFRSLFTRYHKLHSQLQLVYALTLEPGADAGNSWNRVPRWDALSKPQRNTHRQIFDRRSGRGGRGGRRGGRYTSTVDMRDSSGDPTLRGPWTKEKGEKLGLEVIRNMRKGEGEGNDKELAEGMVEFVQLCQMRFGASQ